MSLAPSTNTVVLRIANVRSGHPRITHHATIAGARAALVAYVAAQGVTNQEGWTNEGVEASGVLYNGHFAEARWTITDNRLAR